jgi:hypothetical protein
MQPDDTVRIPLRARDGSVRAYALVDAADAEWANQWKWHLTDKGYARRSEYMGGGRRGTTKSYFLHREILGLTHGDGADGDHIDLNKLNCRRSNLRVLTDGKNAQNRPGWSVASSKYRGVSWDKSRRKWLAYITVAGKHRRIGRFDSEDDAGEAARLARVELMPYAEGR